LLSFAVGMIATHKHVEDKLLAEIDSVLGDRSEPTHDDLSRFVYLKMVGLLTIINGQQVIDSITWQVLKETLRMFPPAATGRRLPMGYRLGDYVVDYPKTDIIISSYVVHHDPEVLTDMSLRPK
jgi:cytochrome P450